MPACVKGFECLAQARAREVLGCSTCEAHASSQFILSSLNCIAIAGFHLLSWNRDCMPSVHLHPEKLTDNMAVRNFEVVRIWETESCMTGLFLFGSILVAYTFHRCVSTSGVHCNNCPRDISRCSRVPRHWLVFSLQMDSASSFRYKVRQCFSRFRGNFIPKGVDTRPLITFADSFCACVPSCLCSSSWIT